MSLIYKTIEQWQGEKEWGKFLDTGTRDQSLKWVLSLNTTNCTAINGSEHYYNELLINNKLSENKRLIVNNWINNNLLENETFDTILADYLLGAIDGFLPYFQNNLLPRLKRHLSKNGTLYFVGLEPFPDYTENKSDMYIIRISKLRDACILHAGHRCYREYPLEWVQSELVKNGFEITKTKPFFNQFGMSFVKSQLDVARSKLPFILDTELQTTLQNTINQLETETELHINEYGPISFGFDYLIQAKLKEN